VDFMEVAADKLIHVTTHVTLAGETPKGVKEGGILQHITREILIECLPGNIPDHISIDASGLGMGESVHVGDLKMPEGTRALTEADSVVVTIAAPISAEKLEAMLAAETAAEVKEPEVLKKAKEE